jgi:hypothetical protein
MKRLFFLPLLLLFPFLNADTVFNGDAVIRSSLAVGFDAADGEDFGFDTIRLKENNTRLRFLDTSNSGSFPTNDWILTANDSTNGGRNYFSIDDADADRKLFTVEAGAPQYGIYLNSAGQLGLETDAPARSLHIAKGDSPAIRLDQTDVDGLAAQAWDLVGNEAGFAVRDDTNGGPLPFRVKPASFNNALVVGANGVGLGLSTPLFNFHVVEPSDEQAALIENTNTTNGARTLLELKNKGDAGLRIRNTTDTGTPSDWAFTVTDAGTLVISQGGVTKFTLSDNGNLTITGTLSDASDVNRKEAFSKVDPHQVLEQLSELPIQTWRYKGEETVHLGPMAQDFHRVFSVGPDETVISKVDADGVAFAAIQALHADAEAKEKELQALRVSNRQLEERLKRLEGLLVAP